MKSLNGLGQYKASCCVLGRKAAQSFNVTEVTYYYKENMQLFETLKSVLCREVYCTMSLLGGSTNEFTVVHKYLGQSLKSVYLRGTTVQIDNIATRTCTTSKNTLTHHLKEI